MMKIRLNRTAMSDIDKAFEILKENQDSEVGIDMIKTALENCFDYTFNIRIVRPGTYNDGFENTLFVMSVFPEISTVDKIISATMTDSSIESIKKLWETNKKWEIEIDSRLFNPSIINCSNRELTAILLHEVGHIVYSNDIPNRVSTILKYEIMKSKMKNRLLLKDKVFRLIMTLPVLDACVNDTGDKTSLKEELKADTFVKKMGYSKELQSVITKIMKNQKSNMSRDTKMKKVSDYSMKFLDDYQTRKDALAKQSLLQLKKYNESVYIDNVLDEVNRTLFEEFDDTMSMALSNKVEYMQERADKIVEDGYFTEFFIFGKKKLKRIEPYEIDYCAVKIDSCITTTDKMMIVTYITSKLDLVNYYLSILEDPKASKKYVVPHTKSQLIEFKNRLELLREKAINYKLPERDKNILVKWPQGYEG